MVTVELMDWERARPRAAPVRFAVFVHEQRVPAAIELDDMDAECIHAVAFLGKLPVGTGRLLPDGHIGRMAVMKPWRGQGVGGALLRRLVSAARGRGEREVLLSAQVHALGFYRAHGFTAFGDVYAEAGIPHQQMRLRLR